MFDLIMRVCDRLSTAAEAAREAAWVVALILKHRRCHR